MHTPPALILPSGIPTLFKTAIFKVNLVLLSSSNIRLGTVSLLDGWPSCYQTERAVSKLYQGAERSYLSNQDPLTS